MLSHDVLGGPLTDDHADGIGVGRAEGRHYRGVCDAKAGKAVNLESWVDHRLLVMSHRAGSYRVVCRRAFCADLGEECFIRPAAQRRPRLKHLHRFRLRDLPSELQRSQRKIAIVLMGQMIGYQSWVRFGISALDV
jgi:hypothetical protein